MVRGQRVFEFDSFSGLAALRSDGDWFGHLFRRQKIRTFDT